MVISPKSAWLVTGQSEVNSFECSVTSYDRLGEGLLILSSVDASRIVGTSVICPNCFRSFKTGFVV